MVNEENRIELLELVNKTITDLKMFDIKGFGKIDLEAAIKLAEERNQIFYWRFTEEGPISFSTNKPLLNSVLNYYVDQLKLNDTITNQDKDEIGNTLMKLHQETFIKVLAKMAEQNGRIVDKPINTISPNF